MTERRVEDVAVMTFGMEDLSLEDPELSNVPRVFVDIRPKRPRLLGKMCRQIFGRNDREKSKP
jgi:hypothetical protein